MDRLQGVADEIAAAGGEAVVIALDVTEQSQINEAVQTVLDRYGQIDILFNNAGFGRLDWLEALETQGDIDAQIDINLRGVIQVARAALPHMLARGEGHIINMSSAAGWVAAPLYSIYAATKFGVRGFSEALRREVAPFGIHVSVIYPGGAATEFGRHTGADALKRSLKLPAWLSMTSAYVARRVVRLAKKPRRAVIVPWWMAPIVWFNSHFPAVVDWAVALFVRRFHHPIAEHAE